MRNFRAVALAAGVVTFVHFAVAASRIGGPSVTHMVSRGAIVGTALFAMLACRSAAKQRGEVTRRGWNLFALAALAWFVANLADAITELRGATRPLPSAADVPAAIAVVAALLAMLAFLGPALSSAARMRTVLDGLVIATSLVFVMWATVLEGALEMSGEGAERALALLIPVGDIVIMALVLVTLTRVRVGARLPWGLLGTGLLLITAGDTVFAYVKIVSAYSPGSLTYVSWVAGCLLVGLAALAPGAADAPVTSDPKPGRAFHVVMPYVPVVVAGLVALNHARIGPVTAPMLAIGSILLVLLLTRQVLAQLENMELARVLDTRVRERTAELDRQRDQFRALVQNATDVVMVVDGGGTIRYLSPSVERVVGFRFSELIGTRFSELLHPEDRHDVSARMAAAVPPPSAPVVTEARLRKRDGDWLWCETSVSDLRRDVNVEGFLLTTRDIGERRHMLDQLRRQALHDPLTLLGNRFLFRDRLDHAIARAARTARNLAVMMIDLDGFKGVNDSLGHAAGDALLREVAERLQASVRGGDTVARMGGDEFAILIEDAPLETAETVATRILNGLRAPIEIEGKSVVCQASIGIAEGSTAHGADELLRNADLAMYAAKVAGKGRFARFDPSMHSAAMSRVELESDLRRAVRERELVLHYQPVVRLPDGVVSGAEALVRWRHPVRGLVAPSEFIPIAEESGLIVELGRWVLREACAHAARFRELRPTGESFEISVNVAARQLTSPWLVKEIEEALEESGLDPACLVLEITEGSLMADVGDIRTTLDALKSLGLKLAIDDFGTGWSSLSRLRSFPVDKLKIDQSFVQEVRSPTDDAPIATAVIAMARSLSLTAVAEGVETVEQLAFLHQHGCDEVQGYLLARPMPADALADLLAQPSGLLEQDVRSSMRELGPSERALIGVVAEATGEADLEVVRPVLAELLRASGMDAVFLTERGEDGESQVIRFATGTAQLDLPEGLSMPWRGSPGARAVTGAGHVVFDLAQRQPDHPLVAAGVRGHVCVPVYRSDREVFGVLCGVSATPRDVSDGTVALFDLFARLLVEHVVHGTPAAQPVPQPVAS